MKMCQLDFHDQPRYLGSMDTLNSIIHEISDCTLCKERFAATATQHQPRPVVWFKPGARILIAGQAPGLRVHNSGKPFFDPSGVRLREWMAIDETTFYDRTRIAIVPMAFCFPGYDAKGADLPPPPVCAKTWHGRLFGALGDIKLKLLIGGYAQKYHLGAKSGVTETVKRWRDFAPDTFPLPHPSWRNTGWLKKNQWFEQDLLPVLRARVKGSLA
jgi:uracil-DNA glycosylase